MSAEGQPSVKVVGATAFYSKPFLPVSQQIEHLKSKGVKFDLYSEADAAEYLANSNNYLRAESYRDLFPRQLEGGRVGDYVGLDFAHLVAFSRFDRRLRETLLLMAIDIEHFARVKVMRLCEQYGEDGHAIVDDFFASLNCAARDRIVGGLMRRSRPGLMRDVYTGDLIAHYGVEILPVWALCEVLEFGPFLTLYKFCAERWGLSDMLQEHYVLKSVKSL